MATSTKTGPDAACAAAVDVARAGLLEAVDAALVGDHLGFEPDGERIVTHRFACLDSGYTGWHWAVTVSRASRSKAVTVAESCLLPGGDSLLAPAWVPWSERVQAGDLGVGDLLPTPADDLRLVPGYTGADDPDATDPDELREVVWELGLGRPRVLSLDGLLDAADRWVNGDGGPTAALARSAPATCVGCGFLVRMSGLLGQEFGLCANEFSPSDGRVVSLDHGCGAHSEAVRVDSDVVITATVVDNLGYDDLDDFGHA